jgi:hypothetical protein
MKDLHVNLLSAMAALLFVPTAAVHAQATDAAAGTADTDGDVAAADAGPDVAEIGFDTNATERVRVEPLIWPTPEMLSAKGREALRNERKVLAREIRAIKAWKPNNAISTSHAQEYIPEMPEEEVDAIIEKLEAGATDDVRDNILRFREALAARIPSLRKALDQQAEGLYIQARDAVFALTREKILRVKYGYQYDTLPPMIHATVTMLEAELFAQQGTLAAAIIFNQIAAFKSRSLTVGIPCRVRAARMYDMTGRMHFGITLYKQAAEIAIGKLTDLAILDLRVMILDHVARDPFRIVCQQAMDATRWFAVDRTGPTVQALQTTLLENMDDMLYMYENDPRFFNENTMRLLGGDVMKAGLPPGEPPDKLSFTNNVAIVGTDDWGSLRPREKQALLQRFHEMYSDRYRTMLETYYRNVSRADSEADRE